MNRTYSDSKRVIKIDTRMTYVNNLDNNKSIMSWTSMIKYRNIMSQKHNLRLDYLYNKFGIKVEENMEKSTSLDVSSQNPIGKGTFGAIYPLSPTKDEGDTEYVVKIQRIEKSQYDLELFSADVALCTLLGENDVGPKIAFDECFVTEELILESDKEINNLFCTEFEDCVFGVIKMEKYTYDLCSFFQENDLKSLYIVEEKLGHCIDKMHDLGVVCSDIKPHNALIKKIGRKVIDVRLTDFDFKFCCTFSDLGPCLKVETHDDRYLQLSKMATKMQMSWTTYLHCNEEVLLFKKDVIEFLKEAQKDETLIPNMMKQNLQLFDNYVLEHIPQSFLTSDTKHILNAVNSYLGLLEIAERKTIQKVVNIIQDRIERRDRNVKKFIDELKPKRDVPHSLKQVADYLSEWVIAHFPNTDVGFNA